MVEVSADRVDFGRIKYSGTYEQEVILTNTGSELVTMAPWASCGCTTPALRQHSLLPGESTFMKIIFTPNSTGINEKTCGVKVNSEAGLQYINIKLIAKVE